MVSTDNRPIVQFSRRVIDTVYKPLTQHYIKWFNRDQQIERGWIKVTSTYPEAIGIIDTKFQQTYRPKGRFAEQKIYFSKKHGAYGIKTEVTHARNGRAMSFSHHVPGSMHDYNLFSQLERVENLHSNLLKCTSDRRYEDTGEMAEKFRLYWAVLMDKAYVGAEERVQAIIPKKKSPKSDRN